MQKEKEEEVKKIFMMNLKFNKKGIMWEMISIILIILIFIISVIIGKTMIQQFGNSEGIANNGLSLNVTNYGLSAFKTFDTMGVLLFVGLILFTIVSAFFIQTYPFFFVIGVFGLLIAIFIAVPVSNVYSTLIQSPAFATSATDFPAMTYLFSKFPLFILIAGILILIGVYALNRIANSGGFQ